MTAIAQDHSGFLWIGTQDGIARWDGYAFRYYRPDPANRRRLPDGNILALHVDARGRLWIGTGSGGLSRYDDDCDCFTNYPVHPGGLSNVTVPSIADNGSGGVWAATYGGLDEVDPARGVIRRLRHSGTPAGGLPNDHVSSVLRDRRGRLWIGTFAGIARRDDDTSPLIPVPLPRSDQRPDITCLFEDSAGRIWIGTKNSGAFLIRPGGRDSRPTPEPLAASAQDGIQSIVEASTGEIWIGTYSRGILVVDGTTLATRRVRHDPFVPGSLDDDLIWALHRDRAGAIWVGTSRGLSRNAPNGNAILTVFGASGRPTGLSDPDVGAVLPSNDGGLWLGLGVNGVDFIDPSAGRVGGIHPPAEGRKSASSPTEILSFLRVPSGDTYIFARNGLFRVNARHGGVERLPATNARMEAGILLSGSNRMWLGSSNDGLWTLDLNTHGPPSIKRYPQSDKLGDPRIKVMARGRRGILWIGTMNGLNRFDPATGAVEQIAATANGKSGIRAPWVSSLLFDRQGRLWVATLGGGISVLEGRTAKGQPLFRHIGIAEGLPDAAVDMLLEAPTGEIWASTDGGLARIQPTTFAVRALRRAEGVAITAYWAGSGAVTANGELAFGGVGGLTIVRPDRVINRADRPPIVVTDLHVGGKPLPWARFNGSDPMPAIAIESRANSLSVEFSALDYASPERSRYAYRLEGFDPDWIETDWAHRVATYTNLPPGRYTLHLRGANGNGVWSEKTLSLPIVVHPAWHQTYWFTGIAILAVLGAIFLLVQLRTSFLRRRQRHLEQQIEERTAELREREHQLEQMAYSDLLTALPNRRMFAETFSRQCALARRHDARFGLLLIDLDRFKLINDTLGHDAGDALLVEAARRFRAAVRRSDHVFRLGGDEFAILLPNTSRFNQESIDATCQRIIDGFAAPIEFNGFEMRTSPSMGVACFPDHGTAEEDLYKAADLALYAAKQAGRNTWRWRAAVTE